MKESSRLLYIAVALQGGVRKLVQPADRGFGLGLNGHRNVQGSGAILTSRPFAKPRATAANMPLASFRVSGGKISIKLHLKPNSARSDETAGSAGV
jgi:hypothetical protein